MKKIILSLILCIPSVSLVAEETVPEKIQNELDEAGKNIKKDGRKLKRNLRDATGNHSTTEDIKDSAKDLKDEIEVKAKKLKRKVD